MNPVAERLSTTMKADPKAPNASFTGRRRNRQTRVSVRVADAAARFLITAGGLGTIVAVATVCVFLVWVAAPLFRPPRALMVGDRTLVLDGGDILRAGADEYGGLCWILRGDGTVQAYHAVTGEKVGAEIRLAPRPVSWSFNPDGDDVCVGHEDGTVQIGVLGIDVTFLSENVVDEPLRALPIGEDAVQGDALYVHTQPGQFRRHRLRVEFQPPLSLGTEPIRLVAHTVRNDGLVIAALAGQTLTLNSVLETRNLLTGVVTTRVQRTDIPYPATAEHGQPLFLLLSRLGDQLYFAWEDGYVRRYTIRGRREVVFAEELDLVPGDARLTLMGLLPGRTTLYAGDSAGWVRAGFTVRDPEAPDGLRWRSTREFQVGGGSVTSASVSPRGRWLAVGTEQGRVGVYQVTASRKLMEEDGPSGGLRAVILGARGDRVWALGPDRLREWSMAAPHGEITWSALFRPVWYEGFDRPIHMWQSSAGMDAFEPKYGLMPLIFGTMKATLYSMLFGLPLALLAAIYTSEFMHPRWKIRIKPIVEMMASLPSVVLGFLAALVVAPWVEGRAARVLTLFALIPVAYLLAAHLWQLLPPALAQWMRRVRIWAMVGVLLLAMLASWHLGPWVEARLFAGDLMRWLDGQIGDGTGGWFVVCLPLVAVAVAGVIYTVTQSWMRTRARRWAPIRVALADLARFLGTVVVIILATWGLARGLGWLGQRFGPAWDPRGGGTWHVMGTYVQRNALVVGFMMGFAIIPIIYTIAEDALSAVPEHLRAASLGAGATPWQTAIRIVVPTAMSGLFSAAMVGLGRAVGETMIVLMAAGNTPIIQMNIFNGFRTLSANIAVEMPEAPVNSTHYRILFFTALVLFAMTFVINTAAETIRQRFRRRAFKL